MSARKLLMNSPSSRARFFSKTISFAILLAGLVATSFVRAQDSGNIRMTLQVIEIPAGELAATQTFEQATALIKESKATWHNIEILTGRSGETSSCEGICELIYPTEYDPTSLPSLPGGKPAFPKLPVGTRTISTAFETRNLGHSLGIQPMELEGGTIGVRLASDDCRLQDIVVLTPLEDRFGKNDVQMPLIHSQRINSGFQLQPGVPLHIATRTPVAADGSPVSEKVHLTFLTATFASS